VDGDALEDLYFVNQVGPNALWRNLGGGRFEDVTARSGTGAPGRIGVGAAFADIDNDGDADLYTTAVRGGNLLLENDGQGRFKDVTEASGLGYVGHSSGALFFDYDRDGRLDLYLTNVGRYTSDEQRSSANGVAALDLPPEERAFYGAFEDAFAGHLKPERAEPDRLYHNEGGNRFRDVTAELGLSGDGWSGDATTLDGNEDGWPDLYVLNMQGDDRYLENQAGARFVERGPEVFPDTPWGSMGAAVLDADGDGRQDLFVTDMHSDMSQDVGPEREKLKADMQYPPDFLATTRSLYGNALFLGRGPDRFEEASDTLGAETYWPWGLSVGDLNADGYEDAFLTGGMSYPYRYGINSLLLNERGQGFRDAEYLLGVEPRAVSDRAWFQLDCSGADAEHEDCTGRRGLIEVWSARSSRASAFLDLEPDGDLDLVTNEFNSEPMVLTSDLAAVRPDLSFLRLALLGEASNRDGLGARVTVTAGGRDQVQVHDGKSGYLAQSRRPLYFGLGEAATVDRIQVDWPSGRRQVLEGPIAANQLLTVHEAGP
jgi:hypothetical protein